METPIVVPLWGSILFRVVGTANLLLSMYGLDAMFMDIAFFRASPETTAKYFHPAFCTMCAINLLFIVVLCLIALDFLRLNLASVRLYAWLVLAFMAYDFLVAMSWFLPNPLGISIAAATGVGNMGTAPFEFAFFFVPDTYPVLTAVALHLARRRILRTQR